MRNRKSSKPVVTDNKQIGVPQGGCKARRHRVDVLRQAINEKQEARDSHLEMGGCRQAFLLAFEAGSQLDSEHDPRSNYGHRAIKISGNNFS